MIQLSLNQMGSLKKYSSAQKISVIFNCEIIFTLQIFVTSWVGISWNIFLSQFECETFVTIYWIGWLGSTNFLLFFYWMINACLKRENSGIVWFCYVIMERFFWTQKPVIPNYVVGRNLTSHHFYSPNTSLRCSFSTSSQVFKSRLAWSRRHSHGFFDTVHATVWIVDLTKSEWKISKSNFSFAHKFFM